MYRYVYAHITLPIEETLVPDLTAVVTDDSHNGADHETNSTTHPIRHHPRANGEPTKRPESQVSSSAVRVRRTDSIAQCRKMKGQEKERKDDTGKTQRRTSGRLKGGLL